jgi:hypothetical protein
LIRLAQRLVPLKLAENPPGEKPGHQFYASPDEIGELRRGEE